MAATPAAVPSLRRLVRRVAGQWGLPDTAVDALALIASELVTNAVVHSGSPDVQLLLTADHEHTALYVRDHGCWHEAHRTSEAVPTGGRGLEMVRAYSELHLARGQNGTTAAARLALNSFAADTP
jgi:anti-sigma regulatory factor (Ser/Thr protein kinase)